MRILYISNSGAMSGAPRALLNLVGALAGRHTIGVVIPTKDSSLEKALKALGAECFVPEKPYPLTVYPSAIRPLKRLRRIKDLKRSLAETPSFLGEVMDSFKPDIVHTNVGPLDYALAESHKRGIPHVWHLREYQDLDFGMRIYPSKEVFFDHLYAPDNYCIAITDDIYEHWGLRCRDRIIYDGVWDGTDYPKSSGNKKYFLYAARIEKAKGAGDAIKAFVKFRHSAEGAKDYRLIVAGRPCGLYAAFWKAYARLFAGRSIEFPGVVEVGPMMSEATATIVASRYEAFGFTTAEAMMRGGLVIGRDTGGTRDQLDRGERLSGGPVGLSFTTVPELAGRMAQAAAGGLDDMRNRALNASRENFSIEKYGREVENYYRRILADEARKPKD